MSIASTIGYFIVALLLIVAILLIAKWVRVGLTSSDSLPMGCSVFMILLVAGLISLVFGL